MIHKSKFSKSKFHYGICRKDFYHKKNLCFKNLKFKFKFKKFLAFSKVDQFAVNILE